ncbi:MAG: hypothetical protein DCE90_16020 [Pseudanabaena sp.]|nr:MAG: hypothetical protein DCE90_16020 [Pseudanabaena sp.]
MNTFLDGLIYACFLAIILITGFSIQATFNAIERRLKNIEKSLGLLLKASDIRIPSHLSSNVQQIALDPYRKIEAIKIHRQETNVSLMVAKQEVEEFIESRQDR